MPLYGTPTNQPPDSIKFGTKDEPESPVPEQQELISPTSGAGAEQGPASPAAIPMASGLAAADAELVAAPSPGAEQGSASSPAAEQLPASVPSPAAGGS